VNNQEKSQNQSTQYYEEYLKNNFIEEFNKTANMSMENQLNVFKFFIESYFAERGVK
jgi:hypothetical protein